MVQATAGGTILSSFCWSAASIMLVGFQLLIMYMIMYEGVDQSCYDHTHCQVGMMCTAGGSFRRENVRSPQGDMFGQCSDCYYATHSDRDKAVLAIETVLFRYDRTFTAKSNPYEIWRKHNTTQREKWSPWSALTPGAAATTQKPFFARLAQHFAIDAPLTDESASLPPDVRPHASSIKRTGALVAAAQANEMRRLRSATGSPHS